jgi:hypothetical protein
MRIDAASRTHIGINQFKRRGKLDLAERKIKAIPLSFSILVPLQNVRHVLLEFQTEGAGEIAPVDCAGALRAFKLAQKEWIIGTDNQILPFDTDLRPRRAEMDAFPHRLLAAAHPVTAREPRAIGCRRQAQLPQPHERLPADALGEAPRMFPFAGGILRPCAKDPNDRKRPADVMGDGVRVMRIESARPARHGS